MIMFQIVANQTQQFYFLARHLEELGFLDESGFWHEQLLEKVQDPFIEKPGIESLFRLHWKLKNCQEVQVYGDRILKLNAQFFDHFYSREERKDRKIDVIDVMIEASDYMRWYKKSAFWIRSKLNILKQYNSKDHTGLLTCYEQLAEAEYRCRDPVMVDVVFQDIKIFALNEPMEDDMKVEPAIEKARKDYEKYKKDEMQCSCFCPHRKSMESAKLLYR